MLTYPQINPVLLSIGPLKVYWYGVMYIIGFASVWWLGTKRALRLDSPLTSDQVGDLIFYGAIGVILGGRIGYMLLYNFSNLQQNPLDLFKVWHGGMSFHGGLIGVLLAFLLYAKKIHKNVFQLTDFIIPMVPIGLAAGRIGNFINGELVGRVTDVPWGMIFPLAGPLPRHPSPIYEFFLEGVLLFIILWIYSSKPRPHLAVSGLFLALYGSFRFLAEFFRQPDVQKGFVAFDWMTMGQLLSLPMILCGLAMLWWAYKHNKHLLDT